MWVLKFLFTNEVPSAGLVVTSNYLQRGTSLPINEVHLMDTQSR